MKSLRDLRQYLIERLKITPENISTFATVGTMLNHYHRENDNLRDGLRIEYTGELLLIDCTLAPEIVAHLVGLWLHKNQPGHAGNAITFDAEILDHNSVDLKITITGLSDRYLAERSDTGTTLRHITNTPADPIIRPEGIKSITLEPEL